MLLPLHQYPLPGPGGCTACSQGPGDSVSRKPSVPCPPHPRVAGAWLPSHEGVSGENLPRRLVTGGVRALVCSLVMLQDVRYFRGPQPSWHQAPGLR